MNLRIDQSKFMLGDAELKIYSGAMHYFRIPQEYWEDRLTKLKLAGFNTVETYVCWNLHEPQKGQYDFEGMLDIVKFIETARKVGLYVIVRPGPYICAEWDFGGFPAWLIRDENIKLRCYDDGYLKHVSDWYKVFLGKIDKLQITKGGNIIAMQVENEYGSYGNDKKYLQYIKDLMLDCGVECLLFTADGECKWMIYGGNLPDTFTALTFGSNAAGAFKTIESIKPNEPKMCAEFWCGWFDHWGERHHTRGAATILHEINTFIKSGASFSFYMFHGGTNFGFNAGANFHSRYFPTVTSYDYCAPISECGDLTPNYFAVSKLLRDAQGLPQVEFPPNSPKQNIGEIKLTSSSSLLDNLNTLGEKHYSAVPLYMEKYGQNFGLIHYHAVVEGEYSLCPLTIEGIHDIAYLYIDGKLKAKYDRSKPFGLFKKNIDGKLQIMMMPFSGSKTIDILVEAMGRVNYGLKLYDNKGLCSVRLERQLVHEWEVTTLPLDNINKLSFSNSDNMAPVFKKGQFTTNSKNDCFVDARNLGKGYIWVNGHNLGRYWTEKGPQKTLYLPGVWLKTNGEANEIIILELEKNSIDKIAIIDKHILS